MDTNTITAAVLTAVGIGIPAGLALRALGQRNLARRQAFADDYFAEMVSSLGLLDDIHDLLLKVEALEAENRQWALQDVERRRHLKLIGDKGRETQAKTRAA